MGVQLGIPEGLVERHPFPGGMFNFGTVCICDTLGRVRGCLSARKKMSGLHISVASQSANATLMPSFSLSWSCCQDSGRGRCPLHYVMSAINSHRLQRPSLS